MPGVDLVAGQLVGRRRPSPRRSARPSRTRRGRPARAGAGSAAKTLASAIAASSSRRASRTASRSRAGRPAGRRRTGRGSRRRRRRRRPAPARDRVAGPARLVLEREDGPLGEDVDDRRDGRREDDDRAARPPRRRGARPGVEDVGQHRPAAQRVEDLGQADFIRVPRPAASTTATVPVDDAGPGGFTGSGAVGPGSRSGRRSRPSRARRDGFSSHQWVGGIVGAPREGCQPSRAMTSISTRAPFGRAATPTVERAGGGSPTKRP